MAANAYPHIVFARDTDALPQQALADILIGLFPEAHVEQGKIKAVLTLDDEYTYTFWYDEEADGLGERYADYAAPVRRRRVEKCTVMIDASGDADAGGTRARDVHRIMAALAERSGVYVFSEESARFVGMDYGDGGAIPSTQSGATPELDPRSEVSPPPSLREGSREVATEAEEM
ncbi:MAG: hypothetical protein Q4G43_17480, partial [Mobilicoccus sp.]|nr:hypothetical protein [Mobilicoccus sp.]